MDETSRRQVMTAGALGAAAAALSASAAAAQAPASGGAQAKGGHRGAVAGANPVYKPHLSAAAGCLAAESTFSACGVIPPTY